MELKGSKTEENLRIAFAGESQARNKYTFFADRAKEEGFEQISALFLETANNEKEHAEIFFNELSEIYNTRDNLIASANGENYEWTSMYPEFAEIARSEGFHSIAKSFENIAKIEKIHEERFLKLLENIENKEVFSKNVVTVWKCRNCGHIHIGLNAPKICPTCHYPQGYFEINCENY